MNPSIWGVRTGCVRNTESEAQHYKNNPTNVYQSNGTLKLVARKETTWDWVSPPSGVTGDPTWGSRNYTSGEIYTKQNFHFGEYTIRCRFPVGAGSWAAFWLFGGIPGIANEIDFFEQNMRNGKNGTEINNVIHWYWNSSRCMPGIYDNYPVNVNNWHVYKCYWTPYEVKFFVDNMITPVYSFSRYLRNGNYVGIEEINGSFEERATFPIHQGEVIANYALFNGVTIDDFVLPQPFEIDYIKVKQFFLAPEITCPTIICSSGTATMDVDPAATNISWALTPSLFFNGYTSGTGETVNITASPMYHGKGKITYTFNMPSGETFTAEKDVWIKGPDVSEVSFDVYRSDGVHATNMYGTWILCPNTTYHIYVMNSSPVPLADYNWTIPSAWTKFYTLQNIISINTNSSPGGPITVNATNTATGFNNTIQIITGYMGSSYDCGSYYMVFSPNPATNETTLEIIPQDGKTIDENTQWELEVYDQQQSLKEKNSKIKGKQTKINTSTWKDGVYIVRVKIGDEMISEKLVVKH